MLMTIHTLTLMDNVMIIVGFILVIAWLVIYFYGLRYKDLFESLGEEFKLKELYFWGYGLTLLLKLKYSNRKDKRLHKELAILYGDKYADYYVRVIYSQKITISALLLVLTPMLYCLAQDMTVTVVMLVFSGLAYYYFGNLIEKKILARSEEMLVDFSDVVSKLALLTNAGMIITEAWEEVAYNGDSTIYQEMQRSVEQMQNGKSEIDAIQEFGMRCIIPEIKKFTSTIVQGMVKGNSELVEMINQQNVEIWNERKQRVRREGEKASSKLLIPILIVFIGILIMIMVPIFANIGG